LKACSSLSLAMPPKCTSPPESQGVDDNAWVAIDIGQCQHILI
jgi:hypothetical protein